MKRKPKKLDNDEEAPKTEPSVDCQFVAIRNNLNQIITFNIRRANGKMLGVQLDASSSLRWPKLPDYGPDVKRLLQRKVLRLDPAK